MTTSETKRAFVLSKINSANGSVIWNKVINPFTDAQWDMNDPNATGQHIHGRFPGYLVEMAVDSTGTTYVVWGTTGTSGYVKYDTNGTLVTTYDRVADTTGETLGK